MRKLGVKNIAEVYEAGFFLCLAGTVQHVSVVIHEYVNQWGGSVQGILSANCISRVIQPNKFHIVFTDSIIGGSRISTLEM